MDMPSKATPRTALLQLVRGLWRHIPSRVRATRPMRRVGSAIYDRYSRNTDRVQSHYTWFLRNPPQLALVADLILSSAPKDAPVRAMSVGCSVGAELYSLLWLLRRFKPDIAIEARGIDIVPEAVALARHGSYRLEAPSSSGGTLWVDGRRVLSTSEEAVQEIFDLAADGAYRVKPAIRLGATWHVGDAADPRLHRVYGEQDLVLACNFLGPMETEPAGRCLRNLVGLVRPGGYLVIDGIDLDVKTAVVEALGLLPITEDARRIHEADPTKQDWPWTRWSLEPFDESRPDWPFRYTTVFQRPMRLERHHDPILATRALRADLMDSLQ